jgi:hypothetical protein
MTTYIGRVPSIEIVLDDTLLKRRQSAVFFQQKLLSWQSSPDRCHLLPRVIDFRGVAASPIGLTLDQPIKFVSD